jgi:rod shape-determining protein MreC
MVGDYFSSLSSVQRENSKLKQEQVANAHTLQQVQQLAAENAQLRRLLDANERLPVKSVMSEILYDARDAFTRKVVLDRGSQHGVRPGQPVIDDVGVVGQVTRVFPFTSEITLLTDKDQASPVQVVRTGLRSIAYGQGHSGALDLRFMPANADIKSGDMLITSGIDGIYPAGLSVAKVTQVESKSSDAFARINCQPVAGIDRNRQLLILLTENNFPERPAPEEARDKKDKASKKKATEAAKEAAKDAPKAAAGAQPATAPAPAAPSSATKPNAAATPATPAAATKPAAAPTAATKPAAPAAPAATLKPTPAAPVATNNAAMPAAPQSVPPVRNRAPAPAATPAPAQVSTP